MLRRISGCLLWPALLLCCVATCAAADVRFVVAGKVIVADQEHSSYLPKGAELAAEFQAKFRAAFPNQLLDLNDPTQMISPDDQVVVIVPTITVARMTDEKIAGSIHNYDAMLVGDVSAIDLWTDANLYSGTRMVFSKFQVGEQEMSALNSHAGSAFRSVASRWMDVTIEQMKSRCAPFVLTGNTLPPPAKAKKFNGGIWSFGSIQGVRTGKTLRGKTGQFAKVVAVFPHYSLIEDVANPLRVIVAGEQYSLTIVEKPTERREPLTQLLWLGAKPSSADGAGIPVLTVPAMLSLFDSELSKEGGIRILPHENDAQVNLELRKIDEELDRVSKGVVKTSLLSLRANLVQEAAENPDRKIEIGILNIYHGTRSKPDNSKENYYRLTLSGCMRDGSGVEESRLYPVGTVVQQVEELANVEQYGIREVDAEGTYLTLFRNAVIHLAEKMRVAASKPLAQSEIAEGTVSASGIDWKGQQPSPFALLTWLRPNGEVYDEAGRSLGAFYRPLTTKRGYLNRATVANEKLESGDILQFNRKSTATQPVVGLTLDAPANSPSWLPEKSWMLRIVANQLSAIAGAEFVPIENGDLARTIAVSSILLSAFNQTQQPQGTSFTGQFRCRVRKQESDPDAEPLLKFGIQYDTQVTLKNVASQLYPPDLGGWGLNFTLAGLQSLSEAGRKKEMQQILSSVN